MKRSRTIMIVISALILALASLAWCQGDVSGLMEAIKSGKVKITDDMIEAQRKAHPELDSAIKAREAEQPSKPEKPEAAGSGSNPGVEKASAKTQAPKGQPSESRFPPELKRFGYDFFTNNAAQGAQNNAPALPDYILSAGDELQIYTWGRETQTRNLIIDNEGMIHFAPLEPIRLAGMKFAAAQEMLKREIEKISGIKASVGLGKLKSIRVFVLGEAVNPGSYVIQAGATVTTALFQSGGIKDIGSLRAIQLKRGGRTLATLDLYDMLLNGNNRTDQQLVTGDVIFVPVAPIQIAVSGMVKRPGIYEVKPNTKVLNALELAGGLSSNAFKGRVRLDRIESHKRKVVLDVGMEKMAGNSNVSLQDGDILNVEEVLAKEFDVVYLEGNVNRPGRYEFKKDMTVKDLIPGVKDLKSETYFSYGHIKRSADYDERSLLIPFSLAEVLEKGVAVPLMPRDTVIIYSKYDIMDQPEVKISGTVRRPGSYRFVERMRISDLIILGGGLTSDAYLPEAHLLRKLHIQESDSLYSTLIKVRLANLIGNPGDENNTELRPSDSLMIFPRSNFILPKQVSISGMVKKGGDFELTQNMGIRELVSQADGLTKNAFRLKIEVVRRTIDHDSVVRRDLHTLSLKEIMEGKADFSLQDGDNVYIREVVDFKASRVITLAGEFNFPGRYEVGKDERLSSVIRRAGGFTPSAYLRGAVFIRQRVREQQLQVMEEVGRRLEEQTRNMMLQTTDEKERAALNMAVGQRKVLIEDVKNAPNLGRVVVELDRELSNAGEFSDLTIENGDLLTVSSYPNTISIMGEVFSPTNVIYSRKNNSIGECLDKAGGVTEYGDAGNVYYVEPDGSIVTPKNTTFFRWHRVEAGGTLVVPAKPPKKDFLDALAKITQIIYQTAISVGVVKTIFF